METYTDFYCDLASVKATLAQKGVAVIPGILSPERCALLREQAWQDMNRLIGLNKDDPETYQNLFNLSPLHSMLIQSYGLGHLQWIWDIRQDPDIVNAFSAIWDTPPEDLITSFDALSFHMPPETTGRGWFEQPWIHTDQSSQKKGMLCVQGSVNLYPVHPGDATLAVLQGSHKYHQDFFRDIGLSRAGDWFRLTPTQYDYFYERGCQFKRVLAPEGSLTLWESRTFHQGSEPIQGRPAPNFRLVCYVCMTPRRLATPQVLQKRRKAFEDLKMTSHWPHQVKTFPFRPKGGIDPGIKLEDIGRPVLSDLGKRLAGF